jgi:hypothetical protein
MLESEVKGIELNVDGTGIAQDQEMLDKIAQDIGSIPLSNFFSIDEERVLDLLGEDTTSMDIPDECWFDPKDGLSTVQSLLNYIRENSIQINENTVADLLNYEEILKEAVIQDVRWHLAIDI